MVQYVRISKDPMFTSSQYTNVHGTSCTKNLESFYITYLHSTYVASGCLHAMPVSVSSAYVAVHGTLVPTGKTNYVPRA